MANIYEVTFVQVTKNAKYARVCGFDIDSGKAFNELYCKQDSDPVVVKDQVKLFTKKYNDGRYVTYVNKVKKA